MATAVTAFAVTKFGWQDDVAEPDFILPDVAADLERVIYNISPSSTPFLQAEPDQFVTGDVAYEIKWSSNGMWALAE